MRALSGIFGLFNIFICVLTVIWYYYLSSDFDYYYTNDRTDTLAALSYITIFFVIFSVVYIITNKTKVGIALAFFLNFIISAPFSFGTVYLYEQSRTGNCLNGFKEPIDALYFSYTTITTLGYGDMSPNNFCRFISSAEAMLGYIFLGTFSAIIYSYVRTRA